MTDTTINLTIFNDFFYPRLVSASNINIRIDNSNIFMNVSTIVSNASNIGSSGPFSTKTSSILVFKNLSAGSFITLVNNDSTLTVNAASSNSVIGASNIGSFGPFSSNSGGFLTFKNLSAGSFITLTSTNTTINISTRSTNIVVGATNIGGNTNGLFISNNNGVLTFKNIIAGTYISVTSNNSTISINSTLGTSDSQSDYCLTDPAIIPEIDTRFVNLPITSYPPGIVISPHSEISGLLVSGSGLADNGILTTGAIASSTCSAGTINFDIGFVSVTSSVFVSSGCTATIPFNIVNGVSVVPVTWSTSSVIVPPSTLPMVIVAKVDNAMTMQGSGTITIVIKYKI